MGTIFKRHLRKVLGYCPSLSDSHLRGERAGDGSDKRWGLEEPAAVS